MTSQEFAERLAHEGMTRVWAVSGGQVSCSWSASGGEVIVDWGLGEGRDGVTFDVQKVAEEAGEPVGTVEVLCYHSDRLYAQPIVRGTVAQIAAGIADFLEEPAMGLPKALGDLRVTAEG